MKNPNSTFDFKILTLNLSPGITGKNEILIFIMIVREANLEDNFDLLELSRESPMQGSLSIYVDRSPDYFYLPALQGHDSKVLVAERKGEIVGTVGYSFRNVRLFGNGIKIGYIGGLKIKESVKGTFTLYRLMKEVYKKMLERNIRIGILFALKENQKLLRVISGRLNIPKFHPIAIFKIFHIIALFCPKRKNKYRNKYRIERPSQSDLEEIQQLFSKFFKKYELIEDFDDKKFREILNESRDFSLDNFLVARKNGNIVAILSYWNQINFKKTIVQKYGGTLKFLYLFLKPLNLFPQAGNPLKVLAIRYLVYEEGFMDAVKELIRHVCKEFHSQFKFIRIGLHERDPLIQCLKGFPKIQTDLVLYAAFRGINKNLVNKLRNSLIWEDIALH
ncbi:GNAT family N-acetyltransferase [Candidatus Aminicenantes bacterium AC-335-A11]|jgi:hypothetical protein|nr:GNAT family N-acetyltransferase [SCandidatus Aminicenantes bacterium Aminicenantia_JdfR_composite]MCP2596617.1 GNAT family N-acetyltransferase [Candidatus Aminicenantes bacterium AC-335-G13]MCP2598057.1 GNAT family N-acetyltransferase [Candidatus Aminicenantes bacterium AC-335-L06]MCP2606297.1 GNAT family N-acetyltransferase [Candidatus Aminicenantes bacterium AC-708-I09]MCP2618359.1 GNAT family N-acetyltransferase [Candidatus Aminicenantes bacterium AC-335-A11]